MKAFWKRSLHESDEYRNPYIQPDFSSGGGGSKSGLWTCGLSPNSAASVPHHILLRNLLLKPLQ